MRYFILSLSLFSAFIFANNVPDDFMAMYEYKETKITVTNVEGKRAELTLLANYNTVKINSKKSEIDFRHYLTASRVKEKTINTIIRSLKTEGIENSALCVGVISECVVNSQKYDFVYDFDKMNLYVYFSPTVLLDNKNQQSYVNNHNKDTALVNHVDAYLSADTDSNSLSVNDLTSVGLAYGYLSSDVTAYLNDSGDDYFDVNKLSYNIDFNAYQLQVGLFDNNQNTNATDVLFEKDNTKDLSIHFGSSKNLLENSESYYKKVYFYAPSAGSMTVYKDGRIIKQYTVNAGSGNIPYTELPSGRYDVRIEIVSNGVVSLNQIYPVYNTGDNTLSAKESSFMFSVGVYKESSYTLYDNPDDPFEENTESSGEKVYAEDFDDTLFLKGLYSYQVNNTILVGTGLTVAKDNNLVGKIASKLMLPVGSDITYLYSHYNQGSSSQTINLNTRWFGLNYEDYDYVEEDVFAEYLQGSSSRKSLTVNTNYNISSRLSGQSSYSYGESGNDYEYWSINSSLNYQFAGGNLLNANLMYAGYGEETNSDGLELTLNLTIPLGDSLTATSSLYTHDGRVSQFTNGLETSDLIENKDQNLQVKVAQSNYSDQAVSEIVTYGNASGRTYESNIYAYADTSGERYVNAGFSSSQVVTEDGVIATNKKSDSYLLLNVDTESENVDNLGLLSLKRNERNVASSFIYDNQILVPLDKYESYQGEIDTESVSLENYGDDSFTGFSFPGSIYQMDVQVGKVITFVATFDDLFANTVEGISCQGDGCVDITPISDGVYKVAVREGQEFILRADDMVCLTPGVKNITSLNLGQNYCVPFVDDESDAEFRLADKEGKDKPVYYIGKFKDTKESKEVYSYLNKKPYKLIEKKIEDDLLVYVTVDNGYEITQNDKTLFNNILMTADNDSRFGVPVVLVLDDSWR
ncbi:TcfC E-set like domain-containing protein [Aliivibrio salmonicida]|uniref:TcfC E-set like domain-containing protein n=1 Tax=Aliivibrio salmonicida TaxID=40269 RepID=UPI003D108F06